MSDESSIWTDMRIGWAEAAIAERAEREAWAKLTGWITTVQPEVEQRVLGRWGDDLPSLCWLDDEGRWWACNSGDIWPTKAPTDWIPMP